MRSAGAIVKMKATLNLWFVLVIALAGTGCVSSYKYVRVSVTDSVTKQPVPGAVISTSYGTSMFSLASRHPSKGVTDESGTALVRVNYLRTEPTLLGCRRDDGIVVYYAAISNDRYQENISTFTVLTWFGMDRRPSNFVPRTPDIYLTVTSEEEKARRKAEAQRKEQVLDQEVEKLFSESPDFWPQQDEDPHASVEGATVVDRLLSRRWESASTIPRGSKEDIRLIREVVAGHVKGPKTWVGEIRWLTASRVMVLAGWYHGPLAAAGYWYVLEKKDGTWEVVTRYLRYMS